MGRAAGGGVGGGRAWGRQWTVSGHRVASRRTVWGLVLARGGSRALSSRNSLVVRREAKAKSIGCGLTFQGAGCVFSCVFVQFNLIFTNYCSLTMI